MKIFFFTGLSQCNLALVETVAVSELMQYKTQFSQRLEPDLPSLFLDVIVPQGTRRLPTSVATFYWNTKVKTVSLNKLNFFLSKTRIEL